MLLRASILAASLSEPVPGWTDGLGFLGAFYAMSGHGIRRRWPLDPNLIGDQIPVDLAANQLLAAVLVCRKTFEQSNGQEAFLLTHACSSSSNSVTWGEAIANVEAYLQSDPFEGGVKTPKIEASGMPLVQSTLQAANFTLKRQLPYMAFYKVT